MLGQGYNDLQRVAFLKDNCDTVEKKGYMKSFTPEQIQQKKEVLSNTDITINDIEEEKKQAIKDFKAELKPLKEQRKDTLKNLKQKAEFVEEICYKFSDPSEKMVGYYNADGILIEARPMLPEEMQSNIFQMARNMTGTDN